MIYTGESRPVDARRDQVQGRPYPGRDRVLAQEVSDLGEHLVPLPGRRALARLAIEQPPQGVDVERIARDGGLGNG